MMNLCLCTSMIFFIAVQWDLQTVRFGFYVIIIPWQHVINFITDALLGKSTHLPKKQTSMIQEEAYDNHITQIQSCTFFWPCFWTTWFLFSSFSKGSWFLIVIHVICFQVEIILSSSCSNFRRSGNCSRATIFGVQTGIICISPCFVSMSN